MVREKIDKLQLVDDTLIDRSNSKIITVGIDGSKKVTRVVVDTLSFRVFALLICRGTLKEKANALFDMGYGNDKG